MIFYIDVTCKILMVSVPVACKYNIGLDSRVGLVA
jgi:hypothetical protein